MEVNNLVKQLESAGIFPYGSEQLGLQENRLERALARSYRQAKKHAQKLSDVNLSSKEGPIAEETERLMLSHYDERAELFINFLDTKYMAYSMAYYGEDAQSARSSNISLEEAQAAKFEIFCQRAKLKGDERILNIGCGFGSLEKFLLDKYPDMHIVGITPSKVQLSYLNSQMELSDCPLSSGRFSLIEGTLDEVELEKETFDAVFSVGVLEHIKNMQAAFERMAYVLKPGGIAFHHLIASYYTIPRFIDTKKTRIDEYFPGGRVWPFSELEKQTEFFTLENSWYLNGINYWKTLDEWHRRFWANIEPIRAILDEEAIRHWNDYFSLCKIVFSPMDGEMF